MVMGETSYTGYDPPRPDVAGPYKILNAKFEILPRFEPDNMNRSHSDELCLSPRGNTPNNAQKKVSAQIVIALRTS